MTSDVLLREVTEDDLPIFFEQQLDLAANYMAAFTAGDPAGREGFPAHWTKILGDETITIKTLLDEPNLQATRVFERLGLRRGAGSAACH